MSDFDKIIEIIKNIEKENIETVEVAGFAKKLKISNGVYLPSYIKNLSSIKNIDIKSDDTFVIGYLKSGTTWVEEIVWLIMNNANTEEANRFNHFKRIIYLDPGMPSELLKILPTPRIFKSHLPPQFFPNNFQDNAKVIFVVRNPKDTLLSLYNFMDSFRWDQYKGTFDHFLNLFIEGKIWYGFWCNYVDSFVNLPNIKIIHYEELLKNPHEKVKEISEYLEKRLNEEQIDKIIQFTSFQNMKNNPSLDFKAFSKLSIFDSSVEFFRKGEIGQWYDYFTKEQSDKLDKVIETNLKYKVDFDYGPIKPFKQ